MADHHTLLKEINNYQDTVFGILAFLNECGWSVESKSMDPELKFGLGRRMSTSSSNRVSPNNDVTPDLVVQKGGSLHLVAEAKHSWSAEGDWNESVQQVRKYDDDLSGWWTADEKLQGAHDMVLLVHGSQAVHVSDFITRGVKEKGLVFDRRLAVVGY